MATRMKLLGGMITVIAALCLLIHAQADAQQGAVSLPQAIALFEAGDYEQAINVLSRLLEAGGLARKERSQARKYIGLSYIALGGQEEKVVRVFKELTIDDPGFAIDDLGVGGSEPIPDAVRYLGQAVLEVRQQEIQARAAQLSTTSRKVALLRSSVLPGWGQRYQGYRGRGYMMLSMTSASLVYAVLARRWYKDAQSIYQKAPREADFPKLYDDYTSKADRMNLVLGVVGAVWMFNVLDAAIQGPALPRGPQRLSLDLQPSDHGLQVAFTKRF